MSSSYTGTHEPLFIQPADPNALFTKEAAISRMPDDEKKWPAHLLSELHKQLPFLSSYDVDISLNRVEVEQGFALGYAMIRNKASRQVAMEEVGKPQNRIRIPLIITDRQLQPFHVFELGGACYPLTKERIQSAMLNPEMFDGSVKSTPGSPGLSDNLFPPYQQRQGFGAMSTSGMGGSASSSSSKTGSASWEDMFVKEARVYSRILGSGSIPTPMARSDEKWSDQFADTPFYKDAVAVERIDAHNSVADAKKNVLRAQESVKDAEHGAKIASLEEQLLNWVEKTKGPDAKIAMTEKLASPSSSPQWSDHFKNSPFFKEAMVMEAADARHNADRAKNAAVMDDWWARDRERNVARTDLEAKMAEWKLEVMGISVEKTAAALRRFSGGGGLPGMMGIAGRKRIAGMAKRSDAPAALDGDDAAKAPRSKEQGIPEKGWKARLTKDAPTARGPATKSASVLQLIAGTINKGDFARFEASFADPAIRPFVEKNAELHGSLARLLTLPILDTAELRKVAMDAARNREPTVLQLRPSGYGYVLKTAVAPDGVEPQEMSLTAEQAQQMLPQGMTQAADQQGAATATQVQAEPDPLVEQPPQPVTTPGIYKVFEAGTGRQIVGFVIPGLIDPVADMVAQQQAQQQAQMQQQQVAQQQQAASSQQAAKKPAAGEKKPEKKESKSSVTVNVHAGKAEKKTEKKGSWWKLGEGEQPQPGAPAPSPQMGQPMAPPPASIFVNGGQYAMGTPIFGKLVGVSFDLPASQNMRGLGIFFKTDGKAVSATVPLQIISEVQVEGRKFFAAKTQDGQDCQITLSQGMRRPYAMPSQNPAQGMAAPGPTEIFVPADWQWLALDNPVQLDQGQGNPMMTVQASAQESMAEIRAWRGGCTLSGPVFKKVGSGQYDWVDGLFWLACTGVTQDLGVQMLEKAAESGQVIRVFGLRELTPISDLVKKANISARVDLAQLPPLPRRVNLLKEAAVIAMDKRATALVDVSSVDNVLALNFLNPENVATFVENIPALEESSCKLASLVLATQLGLQAVPKTACVRAMFALEDVITGLKGLRSYSL